MQQTVFPVIDPVATGENIVRLRKARGLTVRDLQTYFGFEEPQAIYKWQWGKSLPSVDNLYALSALLDVSMDEILVSARPKLNIIKCEQQAKACCSVLYRGGAPGYGRHLRQLRSFFQSRGFSVRTAVPTKESDLRRKWPESHSKIMWMLPAAAFFHYKQRSEDGVRGLSVGCQDEKMS